MWLPRVRLGNLSATFLAHLVALDIHEVLFMINNPFDNFSDIWATYIAFRFLVLTILDFGVLLSVFTGLRAINSSRRTRFLWRLYEFCRAVAVVVDDAAQLSYTPTGSHASWTLQIIVGALAVSLGALGFQSYIIPNKHARFPSATTSFEVDENYTDDAQEPYSDEPLAIAYQAQESLGHDAALDQVLLM
jgi:hypothetical protein